MGFGLARLLIPVMSTREETFHSRRTRFSLWSQRAWQSSVSWRSGSGEKEGVEEDAGLAPAGFPLFLFTPWMYLAYRVVPSIQGGLTHSVTALSILCGNALADMAESRMPY